MFVKISIIIRQDALSVLSRNDIAVIDGYGRQPIS